MRAFPNIAHRVYALTAPLNPSESCGQGAMALDRPGPIKEVLGERNARQGRAASRHDGLQRGVRPPGRTGSRGAAHRGSPRPLPTRELLLIGEVTSSPSSMYTGRCCAASHGGIPGIVLGQLNLRGIKPNPFHEWSLRHRVEYSEPSMVHPLAEAFPVFLKDQTSLTLPRRRVRTSPCTCRIQK